MRNNTMQNMNKKISLDDVIAQLRNSKMERVVDAGRIKGGQAPTTQDGCHCTCGNTPALA
ncbi:hypothetical protein DB30_05232 [Enhygromyxa salina]|uniref:Uncharacterized protein n=1 Tax=Enhygromyxa salina TaxID=215803 RepID=A0A0C1ZDU2_9BACT|nr:hypothetical protein [Enhygromyxa salina]KIG15814.1 hypothetical protein DB30_05232 [Enhygromyxa salina]